MQGPSTLNSQQLFAGTVYFMACSLGRGWRKHAMGWLRLLAAIALKIDALDHV